MFFYNRLFFIILLFYSCSGFVVSNINIRNSPCVLYMNQELPPTLWSSLSSTFKRTARNWFIQRAEKKNISWNELTNRYRTKENKKILLDLYEIYENKQLKYPGYYTLPFHGYDTGNLNWQAAEEGEAATISMSVNYWDKVSPSDAEKWVRYNISNQISCYLKTHGLEYPRNILDMGCSIGVSTEYLYKTFPKAINIQGLDLSPYFLSVASFRANEQNLSINYIHANAENTGLRYGSYDMIVCNFLLHEVPYKATTNILNEIYRLLKPDGIVVIVDLDPKRVKDNLVVSQFRKWAFEVTEPHIYEYYQHDMSMMLLDANFKYVVSSKNDPINRVWIGRKENIEFQMYKKWGKGKGSKKMYFGTEKNDQIKLDISI
uniref:Methyltransferase domain-containing protein n=1 Tax=viral metagenome TaxID=1070528 RepID=A0A6C0AV81_9ZZZZ